VRIGPVRRDHAKPHRELPDANWHGYVVGVDNYLQHLHRVPGEHNREALGIDYIRNLPSRPIRCDYARERATANNVVFMPCGHHKPSGTVCNGVDGYGRNA
jgi:hypothetical protein